MTKLDWREFEASIREECQLAISRWMKRNPNRQAYAIAFHECYAEMDGVVTIPKLGINVSDPETLVTNFEETGWEWNSADWPWLDIFPSRTRLNRLEPLPFDYQYTERLLAMRSASIRRQVADELKPGSSKIRIAPEDIEEALRGLASDELILRQHAVCVLGDRRLGVQCGKRILPALAERLNDSVANCDAWHSCNCRTGRPLRGHIATR